MSQSESESSVPADTQAADEAPGGQSAETAPELHPANPEETVTFAEKIDPATLPQTFAELALTPAVLESIIAAKFSKPTIIQALFIPKALTGRDVMGQARTGTGKTCAFVVPIFERIQPARGKAQALILAPTRELALQITAEIDRLGSTLGFSAVTLYGGSSYEPQIEALEKGVNIVVGTPGRVMDHMRSGRLDLSAVKIAVLDEADRMLDLGFRKDIEYILKHCPKKRQTLLLSATIPDEIKRLTHRFMHEPLEVWTAQENVSVDTITQHYCAVSKETKLPTLLKILDVERPQLAIIFCGTKFGAKKLADRLKALKISAREIHGDLQQSRREKIMARFRSGKIKLLIATDVASRGIDVQDISHVFNYDVPYKIEDYVHRIGRTGRIGKSGCAYTLVLRDEAEYLTQIEQLVNRELDRVNFDDLNSVWWPTPPATPDPDFFDPEFGSEADGGDGTDSESGRLPDDRERSGSGGGGGAGKKRRSRGTDRGGRGGRSERGERSGRSERSAPAATAAAVDGAPAEAAAASAQGGGPAAEGTAAPRAERPERPGRRERSGRSSRGERSDRSTSGSPAETPALDSHSAASAHPRLGGYEAAEDDYLPRAYDPDAAPDEDLGDEVGFAPSDGYEVRPAYERSSSRAPVKASRRDTAGEDRNGGDGGDGGESEAGSDGGEGGASAPNGDGRKRRRRRRGKGGNTSAEPVAVTCSTCGAQTTVNFVPDPAKPIYCQPCYTARKAERRAKPASVLAESAPPPDPAGEVPTA